MKRSARRWLDGLVYDSRFGLRMLRRTPLASGVMIASIALGIGVTTAVFTLTDAMLLRPLPYPQAERLVVPYQTVVVRSRAARDTVAWSFARYEVLRRTVRGFEEVGFAAWLDATLRNENIDRPVRVEAVTRSLLSTFQLRPQVGRLFGDDEDQLGMPTTAALISDRLWRTVYGSSPAIRGASIRVNGVPLIVVGVMPPRFNGFSVAADIWVPIHMTARVEPSPRWTQRLDALTGTVIGRMRGGTTTAALHLQLVAAFPIINATATDQAMGSRDDRGVGVMSLQEARRHPLVKPILALMGVAVLSLLFIVCANIGSILLARGHERRSEMGVRVAVGATQQRVSRQVLTESMLLSALALPLGIAIGSTAATTIAKLRPALPQNWVLLRGTDLLAEASLSPNGRILAFASVIAALATIIFGTGPAIVASRVDAAKLLMTSGDSHGPPPTRGRQLLVVSQVALATILLVIAGLTARSLDALLHTDLGFEPTGVTVVRIASMDTSVAARVRRQELVARLETTPGITAVAMSGCRPFDLACFVTVGARGDDADASGRALDIETHTVSAPYFRVMRVPITSGRAFVPSDTLGSGDRVVLSEAGARRLFGTPAAVGKFVRFNTRDDRLVEVIGIVGDTRIKSVEAPPAAAAYFLAGEDTRLSLVNTLLFVRANLAPDVVLSTIRREISVAGAPMTIVEARSMTEIVRMETSSTRFIATMLVGFAASAMLIAALGVYGVVSYIVSRRTREFGVKLVLGADGRDLAWGIIGWTAGLVIAGIAAGVTVAAIGARLLGAFLYGIGALDPATYGGVIVVVASLGLVATLLPARRVTRIDPALALRS